MTNVKGEKTNPNADLNSYYAFLWYANQDVCKRYILERVLEKLMEGRGSDAYLRLLKKMNEKCQAFPLYPKNPKPYFEM